MKDLLSRASLFSRRSLAILTASLCLSMAAHSGEDQSGTFRFNISPNGYPPYLIVDGEKPSGIMWDVVALIVPRLGYDLEFMKIPRKRVDQMLADGFLDGTPRAIEWTEKPEQYLFTNPVVHVEEVFFFANGAEFEYNHPSDLFGKTVVTHLGYMYPALDSYFESEQIRRFDVSRDRDMFRFLLHGERFDTALADRLVGQWILKTEGMAEHFSSSETAISQYGFRIMVRPEWTEFVQAFNEELQRVRENGELQAILANYR